MINHKEILDIILKNINREKLLITHSTALSIENKILHSIIKTGTSNIYGWLLNISHLDLELNNGINCDCIENKLLKQIRKDDIIILYDEKQGVYGYVVASNNMEQPKNNIIQFNLTSNLLLKESIQIKRVIDIINEEVDITKEIVYIGDNQLLSLIEEIHIQYFKQLST